MLTNQLMQMEISTRKIVNRKFGSTSYCNEPSFIPSITNNESGYLIIVIYNGDLENVCTYSRWRKTCWCMCVWIAISHWKLLSWKMEKFNLTLCAIESSCALWEIYFTKCQCNVSYLNFSRGDYETDKICKYNKARGKIWN